MRFLLGVLCLLVAIHGVLGECGCSAKRHTSHNAKHLREENRRRFIERLTDDQAEALVDAIGLLQNGSPEEGGLLGGNSPIQQCCEQSKCGPGLVCHAAFQSDNCENLNSLGFVGFCAPRVGGLPCTEATERINCGFGGYCDGNVCVDIPILE